MLPTIIWAIKALPWPLSSAHGRSQTQSMAEQSRRAKGKKKWGWAWNSLLPDLTHRFTARSLSRFATICSPADRFQRERATALGGMCMRFFFFFFNFNPHHACQSVALFMPPSGRQQKSDSTGRPEECRENTGHETIPSFSLVTSCCLRAPNYKSWLFSQDKHPMIGPPAPGYSVSADEILKNLPNVIAVLRMWVTMSCWCERNLMEALWDVDRDSDKTYSFYLSFTCCTGISSHTQKIYWLNV